MTRLGVVFVCFLLFLSCTSNTILEPPKDLIPKETMISIFVDLHLAQAGKNVKNLQQKRDENYFQLVYEKYQIDTIHFKESNNYYASLIDDYHLMFVEVERRLEQLHEAYMEEREKEDSLKSETLTRPELTPRELMKKETENREDLNLNLPLSKKDSLIY